MIKTLEIKNFKSIKNLKLNCRRINVFIGEPNTGKSNILETIGILSFFSHGKNLDEFVRFENITDLFYDKNLEEAVEISIDNEGSLIIRFVEGNFYFIYKEREEASAGKCDYKGIFSSKTYFKSLKKFKFYRFGIVKEFKKEQAEYLYPARGDNLLSILLTRNKLKRLISQIVSNYGLKIALKPVEHKIEILKEIDEVIISYPYSLLSDTLQRIIFHIVAIETNEDSIIAFEEPEAHAFPYYTKFLAERIALDKKNQYFISTHNPYFLLSLLEKSPKEDIAIFLTYFEDYQTKVKELDDKKRRTILDMEADVFFNIEKLLEG